MTKDMAVRIIGALIGVLVGILILTIGFWRTLLIVVLAGLGWYLAGSKAVNSLIMNVKERFRQNGDN